MSWTYLVLAILLDVGATVALKASVGMSRLTLVALAVLLFAASILAVGLALRDLPLVSVYAIWLGLGIALVAIAGGLWFHEPLTPGGWVSIGAIVLGVVGLALSGADNPRSSSEAEPRAAVAPTPTRA